MDLSNFQRKVIIFLFASILIGSILLAQKEPLKTTEQKTYTPQKDDKTNTKALSTSNKLDINTASLPQIMQLPGIGPSLAQSILDYRKENGPFSSTRDLLNVPGIGEKRLARIKSRIILPEEAEKEKDLSKNIQGKINLNTASIIQLTSINGIGPKTAEAIINYRKENYRFNNMEELLYIPRIGPKTYKKLEQYLYVKNINYTKTQTASKPKPILSTQLDLKAKCPNCNKQMWEEGDKKRTYIRCPYCMKLVNNE